MLEVEVDVVFRDRLCPRVPTFSLSCACDDAGDDFISEGVSGDSVSLFVSLPLSLSLYKCFVFASAGNPSQIPYTP